MGLEPTHQISPVTDFPSRADTISVDLSNCDPDRIQTYNLLIRSQVLYSVKLQSHFVSREGLEPS